MNLDAVNSENDDLRAREYAWKMYFYSRQALEFIRNSDSTAVNYYDHGAIRLRTIEVFRPKGRSIEDFRPKTS